MLDRPGRRWRGSSSRRYTRGLCPAGAGGADAIASVVIGVRRWRRGHGAGDAVRREIQG